MKTRILILTVLITLIPPFLAAHTPIAAQDTAWRVESPVRLSEALDGFHSPAHQIYVAPDGRHVAYGDPDHTAVCTLDVPTREETCIPLLPEMGYSFQPNDFFPALRWSPDSTKMALIGLPYHYLRDTDLGLVDLSGSLPSFANLADDSYVGTMRPGSIDRAVTIEINPAFSPDSTKIAVERTTVTAEGQFARSTLAVFNLTTGEAHDLSNLPGNEAYEVDAGSIIGMDWSPDGSTLAVALHHQRPDPLFDGIWLVDVASGTWAQLITVDAAQAAVQTIYADTGDVLVTAPLRWSPDGSRLLFWAGDPGRFVGSLWVFWTDLDSHDITAVQLPTSPEDQPRLRMNWPAQAVWSPDGSQLLVAVRMVMPPNPAEAKPLVESGEVLTTALYLIDVPSGDRTLLGHLPREDAPAYIAAWGPDDEVIAGGYSFKLARQ
jgi:Tol biopolymer transport system component